MAKNIYNVRNLMVLKEKNSDFLTFKSNSDNILFDLKIIRVLKSGNYYIYTFGDPTDEQIAEIKNIQDNWI